MVRYQLVEMVRCLFDLKSPYVAKDFTERLRYHVLIFIIKGLLCNRNVTLHPTDCEESRKTLRTEASVGINAGHDRYKLMPERLFVISIIGTLE